MTPVRRSARKCTKAAGPDPSALLESANYSFVPNAALELRYGTDTRFGTVDRPTSSGEVWALHPTQLDTLLQSSDRFWPLTTVQSSSVADSCLRFLGLG